MIIIKIITSYGSFRFRRLFSPKWDEHSDFFMATIFKPIDTNANTFAGKSLFISMTHGDIRTVNDDW